MSKSGKTWTDENLIFSSKFKEDLIGELHYLRQIDPRLCKLLLDSVKKAINHIIEQPKAMQVIAKNIRRWPLKGFQYGILYQIGDTVIYILALFHPRRDPSGAFH